MSKFLQQSYWEKATPESVKKAIEQGVDVNARDKNGRTPLMHAVSHIKNPEVTQTEEMDTREGPDQKTATEK